LTDQVHGLPIFFDPLVVAFRWCGYASEVAVVVQIGEFHAAADWVGGCSPYKGFIVLSFMFGY
jgi:hypothetical protein